MFVDPVVECIDVDSSDETDYSTDQDNPGDLYDVSDEEPGHTPVQVGSCGAISVKDRLSCFDT